MQNSASKGFRELRSSNYPSTSPDQYERAFNSVGNVNTENELETYTKLACPSACTGRVSLKAVQAPTAQERIGIIIPASG
jgi:hypothetical protein